MRTADCDGSESGSLACSIKQTALEVQKLDGAPNCNKLSVFPGCDPEQTYEEDLSSDQDVTVVGRWRGQMVTRAPLFF